MTLRLSSSLSLVALVSLLVPVGRLFAHGRGCTSAIEAAAKQWEDAIREGDAAAAAALYTEDAMLLPPGSDIVTGRPAIEAFYQALLGTGIQEIRTETVEISTSGNLGYRVTRFVILGSSGQVLDEGKALEVWRRVHGVWRFQSDCFNSSL